MSQNAQDSTNPQTHGAGARFRAFLGLLFCAGAFLPMTPRAQPENADALADSRAAITAYTDGFRIEGAIDSSRLVPVAEGLRTISANSRGELRARALLELGTVQRLQNQFDAAIATLTEAAEAAATSGLRDAEFDAWIGAARANLIGTHNHGAAATAFQRAADAAGDHATAKQRFDLISYQAEILLGRGEVEAGLVEALEARRLAPAARDRFYAEMDIADGLQKLAESCDYRKLPYAAEASAGSDGWNGCRRAVAASHAAYEQAAETADGLGWRHMAAQMRGFQRSLQLRLQLIETRAKFEQIGAWPVFSPRERKDVLVNKQFESGASGLSEFKALADLSEQVAAEADALTGRPDARSAFLKALAADIRGDKADSTVLYVQAAALLAAERSSFFDPRRRGTVIENRAEIVRDLALRLLARGREDEAFAAFESVRARGLGELAQALADQSTTEADRAWLSALLRLEAQASNKESAAVGDLLTQARLEPAEATLADLDRIRAERVALLRRNEEARERLSASRYAPAGLGDLRAAATQAGVPVLLYWATPTNVVVWYLGPHGSDVRTVFLPESALTSKTESVLSVARQEPPDEAAAKELFLYLIAPFQDLLDAPEILIIPQGPLNSLPFEMLIDPANGDPLIERWAVSYSPNAAMALSALRRSRSKLGNVAAVVDLELDDSSRESEALVGAGVLRRPVAYATDVLPDKFSASIRGADGMHLLLHGKFDEAEPLLSTLRENELGAANVAAADLIALPLNGMKLAVLSACESGRVGTRISNEIYGFPWALMAGGVETVVLSRWLVDGDSNSKWMRSFYEAAAGGASPAAAAARAARDMRRSGVKNPYYWAAMQVSRS